MDPGNAALESSAPVEVDPEDLGTNDSPNTALAEIVAARFSRRAAMTGGLATAALGFLGGGVSEVVSAGSAAADGIDTVPSLLGFAPVHVIEADEVVVPEGYKAEVLIPWGTRILSNGPLWKKDGSNTAAEQALQVGMNHDGMHYFPSAGTTGNSRGVLVLNHEATDAVLLYADGDSPMTEEKVNKALAAHGVTVIQVEVRNGKWVPVNSRFNRRITGSSPVAFSGPVAESHPALRANNPPLGTLNNCAHGYTPWGTYLACEENFNGYFGTDDSGWAPTPLEQRYGLTKTGFGYNWHKAAPRFDLAVNRNEPNRFGWVVEIDPNDPSSTPVKRTALGRVKHEGATVTVSQSGRVVVYTGDDENKEYVYKFVGSERWADVRSRGANPLDVGVLYVGKFNDDGSGAWLPLVHGTGPLTTANGWVDQADVLLRTRLAADAVGGTKLDRPEWVAVDPRNSDVYLTLTNGSTGVGKINLRNPNPFGSIVRWREADGDPTATAFRWNIFLLAGDPGRDPLVSLPDESRFGSPDGIWVDPDGRVWIQTDISNSVQRRDNYARIGNNQMLVADPANGDLRRFLVGPNGCEVTGVVTTPDRRTMFVNIQHPGEETRSIGAPTSANPRAVSNWPDHDPAGRPRSATVVIRKKDGGIIGT